MERKSMLKTVSKPTSLFSEPTADSEPTPLSRGDVVDDLGIQQNGFSKVKHGANEGWVQTKHLKDPGPGPVPAPILEPITPEKLAEVAFAAGKFFEIMPAYLLCLSANALNMTNDVTKGADGQPDSIGVFQFTRDEWAEAVGQFGDPELRIDEIGEPAMQCLLVAAMTKHCIDTFNKPGGFENPKMPHVYLAFLLGWNGADAVMKIALDEAKPIDQGLMAAYNDQGKVDRLMKRRADYFMKGGAPATLKDLLDGIAARMEGVKGKVDALIDAFLQKFPD